MKRSLLALALIVGGAAVAQAEILYSHHYSNTHQATPGNPTGTTNATGVVMGLGGTITPCFTGTVRFAISGTIANATAIAEGGKVQIYYGTGSASANGTTCSTAGTTRTAVGGFVQYIAATTAQKAPFSVQAIVSGLTLGTAYWYDACLAAITAGTATIADVSLSANEL